jgi:outer membrane murein-binding lipoprotein Lpp
MKKFLAIIAIASFAVACNNNGEKKETVDTTAAKMDTVAAKMDTVAAKMDTLAAKMDTVATKM